MSDNQPNYADKAADASGDWDPTEPGSAPHQAAEEETETVSVYPKAGEEQATAQALLDAADDPKDVVFSDGHFQVPAGVASKMKVPSASKAKRDAGETTGHTVVDAHTTIREAAENDEDGTEVRHNAPAKKAAAKKAAAKKASPAKKS